MVIPVPLESISRVELIEEQKSDPSINAFFELASLVRDMKTAAQGYFVKNGVHRQFCGKASFSSCGACKI